MAPFVLDIQTPLSVEIISLKMDRAPFELHRERYLVAARLPEGRQHPEALHLLDP